MFNLHSIMNYFRGRKHLGFDVGATCLKVVKLEKIDGGFGLLKMGISKIPDALNDNERGRNIQLFLRQNGISLDGYVSVNIEDSSLLIRRMDVPKMPDRDTKTAVSWNFREFVSGSIDDYVVSYLPIEIEDAGEKGPKIPISGFCISRKVVEERKRLLAYAGIRPSSIEPNSTALLSAFNHCYRWERDKYYVVVDLGDFISNFVVIGNGNLLFSRPLGKLGGRKLVNIVSKDLSLDLDKADELLKAYLSGSEKTMDFSKVENVVSNFISRLIVDIQRSIDAFCIMYKRDRIDEMLVCGGGICLPDIVARLANGLGIDVKLLNPFQNIVNAETARKMKTAPVYAVAVGLALPAE